MFPFRIFHIKKIIGNAPLLSTNTSAKNIIVKNRNNFMKYIFKIKKSIGSIKNVHFIQISMTIKNITYQPEEVLKTGIIL